MREQTLRRLLALLGALVVLYAAVRVIGTFGRPHGDAGGSLGAALQRLHADTLVSASITSPAGAQIELRRAGPGHWTVNGFPADSTAVARLLSAANLASLGTLAARSAATHAALGVTDSAAWKLTARGAHDSVRLLLGSEGPQYPSGYVRLPGHDTVYTVLGALRDAVATPLTDWRDKMILHLDSASIGRIIFERDHDRYEMRRGTGAWIGAKGPGDSANLSYAVPVISELSRLQASGFPADSSHPSTGQTRQVTVLGTSGDTLAVVTLTGDGRSDWTATVRGNSQRYLLATFDADRLTPKRDDLFPDHKGH